MRRLIQRSTATQPASWADIKAKRNALEVSPVTLANGLVYDYDQQAKLRFETALKHFDSLPSLVDGKLAWKLYDNSFKWHSQAELQSVYDELETAMAVRGAAVFAKAEALHAQGVTLGELDDMATWGLPALPPVPAPL